MTSGAFDLQVLEVKRGMGTRCLENPFACFEILSVGRCRNNLIKLEVMLIMSLDAQAARRHIGVLTMTTWWETLLREGATHERHRPRQICTAGNRQLVFKTFLNFVRFLSRRIPYPIPTRQPTCTPFHHTLLKTRPHLVSEIITYILRPQVELTGIWF